ncbi:hypothetical protein JX265_009805 [Neoarthrinium moseri]|uniref:Uncharacterized protein n=1 Tax=Neoarthrinium moseri TaxID=1658444 RepID=A0A9P9WET1_9PEZI|nr:hypothetical protein JX265_009805 [Neoarthrinium moseri]
MEIEDLTEEFVGNEALPAYVTGKGQTVKWKDCNAYFWDAESRGWKELLKDDGKSRKCGLVQNLPNGQILYFSGEGNVFNEGTGTG